MDKKDKVLTNRWVVMGLSLLCCLLWGSAAPMIKVGYKLFQVETGDTAAQILFAGLRFTFAGVYAVILGSLMSRSVLVPKRSSIPMVIKLSLCQTMLQYFLFYIGVANSTGTIASIISGTNVFIAILIAAIIFRTESLTWRKVIGCILGFGGLILINLGGLSGGAGFRWNGELFILIAQIAYATSSSLLKRYSKYENPVTLSGWQFMFGGAWLIAAGILMGGHLSFTSWKHVAILVYLSLLSAVAYSVWGILMKHNPVSRVAIYGMSSPIFGVLLSALLLGEWDASQAAVTLLALVLVCAGIAIVQTQGRACSRQADTV